MKPYYDHAGITIYHGDCREILTDPHFEDVDMVLTDPPYPDFNRDHGKDWEEVDIVKALLPVKEDHQYIFWPATRDFPMDYSARHVWHKPNGQSNEHYEFIYERNGNGKYRVFRVPIINYQTLPEWQPHPSQKPLKLITALLLLAPDCLILDPFMGSGTTLVAAKQLGRKAIGIEIEEKYCEIAVQKLAQEVLEL